MPRSVRARLDDILEAIAGIQSTLANLSLEAFTASWQLQRAAERGLEIVSEASRSVPDALKPTEPVIVWNIAGRHLTPLETAVRRLIQRLPPET